MPFFIIERRFADVLEMDPSIAAEVNVINDEESVRWLYSFLSADHLKTYCLYEAPSAEAIRTAAVRAGVPADVIVEVTDMVRPTGVLEPI
jgi:hypothetical protein